MKVLVSAATKHGSTAEIAEAIGTGLREYGVDAAVTAPEDARDLDGIDAVVLGSGVYAGHWLEPAKDLVDRLADGLAARPVWLFSVGPVGDPPRPDEEPVDVREIVAATHAREHRLFSGRLERGRLSFIERAIVTALRAPEGDFRDWEEIRAWSREIATALVDERAPTPRAG